MQTQKIAGITLVYPSGEAETAGWIGEAVQPTLKLAKELWGLEPPDDCRIHTMTSALGFVMQSTPWNWKLMLAATIPFWLGRLRRTWPYSAAWTQRYGRRVAIGVKPPRLLVEDEHTLALRQQLGGRMFVEEPDPRLKVQQVACHELVHACSAYLHLPLWLNEGIATLTVDRLMGKPTIRSDTLAFVRDFTPKSAPPTYRALSQMGTEAMLYHSLRGYWLVSYFESQSPGMLKQLFSLHSDGQAIEGAVIQQQDLAAERFWQEIDAQVAEFFEKKVGLPQDGT